MSWLIAPKDADVEKIISLLTDQSQAPLFIHCTHGQDRTGLIMGLYRIFVDKWSSGNAYDEMLKIGFHPEFFALDHYFKSKTQMP